MSKHKINLPLQALTTGNLNTAFSGGPPGANDIGSIVYNNVSNSLSVWNGSSWDGLKEALNGKIITVDTNSPNATNTRTGLSKYSANYPFLTIQAALNALDVTDNFTVIYVNPGQYSENVVATLTTNVTLIYNKVNHIGTTSSALDISGTTGTISLVLINSNITNTGNAADRGGTAAVRLWGGNIFIEGIGGTSSSNYGSSIQSVEGSGLNPSVNADRFMVLNNIHIKSTNGRAVYPNTGFGYDDSRTIVRDSVLESTNASAFYLTGVSVPPAIRCRFYNSRIIGSTYAIEFHSNMRLSFEMHDCIIESTNGPGIGGGAMGGNGNQCLFDNCTFKTAYEALVVSTGNTSIEYIVLMYDCKITILNEATRTFALTNTSNTATYVGVYNTISNREFATFQPTFDGTVDIQYSKFKDKNFINNINVGSSTVISSNYIGSNGTSGSVAFEVASSNKGLVVPRVATLASIVTPQNGMIAYANNSNTFQGYANGAWVGLGASTSGGGGGNVTASNGLTKTGDDIALGGSLITPTTITTVGSDNLTYDWDNGFSSTGQVVIGGSTSIIDASADDPSFGFSSMNVRSSSTALYHESAASTEAYDVTLSDSGIDINATYNFEDYTKLNVEAASIPNQPILRVETYDFANGVQNTTALKIDKLGFTTSLRNTADVEIAKFEILNAGTTYTDGRATKRGIEYAANYASTYSNRSIVDKQYVVDSIFQAGTAGIITASNGLTKVGSDIRLGGALTANTSITGGGSNFNLQLGTGIAAMGSITTSSNSVSIDANSSVAIGAGGNVSQFNMSSTSIRATRIVSGTNTYTTAFQIASSSIGTVTNGFGAKLDFAGEDSINGIAIIGSVGFIETDVTNGSVDSKFVVTSLLNNSDYVVSEMSNTDVKFWTNYATITAGTAGTAGSAALEIIASNKALLLPRLTSVSNVATPVDGMIVYATESYGTSGLTNADVYAYSSNSWQPATRKRVVEQFISGSVTIDLSTGTMFKLTINGNVTNFTFTNEVVGRDYIFIFIKATVNYTFTWATGKYRFSFGTAPVLTDPTANGTTPPTSKDIITALCSETGRLDIVMTPDLIAN